MKLISHEDKRMHRINLYVTCKDTPALEENVYEEYTLRTYKLLGIPIWFAERDTERKPMHEFIEMVFG